MEGERVWARYLVETAGDIARAVAAMAGEQSSGTFVSVPGETAELKARSAARVEKIELLGEVAAPALPGARAARAARPRQALATLSWPVANFGLSLPNLFTTVAGNLFELGPFSGLKVLDVGFSPGLLARYGGPRHGVAGTRALAGVPEGPVLGTIVKPSVGLDPEGVAALVAELGAAGLDFVKDDELQADGPVCPFDARVRRVTATVERLADRTGRKLMYAFNLTGEIDEMRRRADLVEKAGGTCVMVVLNSAGLAGVIDLARHTRLPVHGHRAGWGALGRHPAHGWSYVAWHRFWRLAGVDHLHVNGLANKFCESDDSVIASARAVLAPMAPSHPMTAMPVFSSGQTVHQAAPTRAALGCEDLMYLAGGGILGHPQGARAGVEALREAWAAARAGEPLTQRAARNSALAAALRAFGA